MRGGYRGEGRGREMDGVGLGIEMGGRICGCWAVVLVVLLLGFEV